jgi:hypothetical protein
MDASILLLKMHPCQHFAQQNATPSAKQNAFWHQANV